MKTFWLQLYLKETPLHVLFHEFCKIYENTSCTEHLWAFFLTEVLLQGVSKKSFPENYESFP